MKVFIIIIIFMSLRALDLPSLSVVDTLSFLMHWRNLVWIQRVLLGQDLKITPKMCPPAPRGLWIALCLDHFDFSRFKSSNRLKSCLSWRSSPWCWNEFPPHILSKWSRESEADLLYHAVDLERCAGHQFAFIYPGWPDSVFSSH